MICACGHDESVHGWGRNRAKQRVRMSCTALISNATYLYCKCNEFREARSIARALNPEEGEGASTVMAKEKGRKVVLFEVTAKKADKLLAKDNQTNAAIFYRVLDKKAEPMTRQAIYEASKTLCESAAAWERLGNQTHDTLARLRKAGFVKRIETREAVAEKPKTEKKAAKPRAAKKQKTASAKPNGASRPDITDADLPANEAPAPF